MAPEAVCSLLFADIGPSKPSIPFVACLVHKIERWERGSPGSIWDLLASAYVLVEFNSPFEEYGNMGIWK